MTYKLSCRKSRNYKDEEENGKEGSRLRVHVRPGESMGLQDMKEVLYVENFILRKYSMR